MNPTARMLHDAQLVSQGAEAKVYKAAIHPGQPPICLKHRFSKQYRHQSLDQSLTRSRLQAEARSLLRCLKAGVCVPGLRLVDVDFGLLGTEWIDGKTVRKILGGGDEGVVDDDDDDPLDELAEFNITQGNLMDLIGTEIGKLHHADLIHGDLTTSNMILRSRDITDLVLIDFGLSFTSSLVEDKAVDLYVLERAFSSTHPDSEHLFQAVLDSYSKALGKEWNSVRRRLDDVRQRGRKRSMIG